MEITVVNNRTCRSRVHVVTGDPKGQPQDNITTIKLAPGANLLSGAEALAFNKAIETNAVLALWLEKGELEIKDAPSESKTYKKGMHVKDLAELKPLDALKAVSDCKSIKDLKRFAHQDPRPQIQKAITARYDVLMEKETPKDPTSNAQ